MLFDADGDEDLADARELMLSWDFTADNVGAADAIALLMIRDFMSAEYQNKDYPDVEESLEKASEGENVGTRCNGFSAWLVSSK